MSTDLAPIARRHYSRTFIGGPASGRTRRECWGAETADGRWRIDRIDGEPGTPWMVVLVETGETTRRFYGTLKSARHAIACGDAERAIDEERVVALCKWLAAPVWVRKRYW